MARKSQSTRWRGKAHSMFEHLMKVPMFPYLAFRSQSRTIVPFTADQGNKKLLRYASFTRSMCAPSSLNFLECSATVDVITRLTSVTPSAFNPASTRVQRMREVARCLRRQRHLTPDHAVAPSSRI
jgi:hypothetical protein